MEICIKSRYLPDEVDLTSTWSGLWSFYLENYDLLTKAFYINMELYRNRGIEIRRKKLSNIIFWHMLVKWSSFKQLKFRFYLSHHLPVDQDFHPLHLWRQPAKKQVLSILRWILKYFVSAILVVIFVISTIKSSKYGHHWNTIGQLNQNNTFIHKDNKSCSISGQLRGLK